MFTNDKRKMKRVKRFRTDFLYSTPSFLGGIGTVLNVAGNYYDFNSSDSEGEADAKAIANDFKMIGQDISDSLKEIEKDRLLPNF